MRATGKLVGDRVSGSDSDGPKPDSPNDPTKSTVRLSREVRGVVGEGSRLDPMREVPAVIAVVARTALPVWTTVQ